MEDFASDETLGNCGYSPDSILKYKDLLYNDLNNLMVFEKMLKSYNPELQSNAVEAYEYLKSKKLISKKKEISL